MLIDIDNSCKMIENAIISLIEISWSSQAKNQMQKKHLSMECFSDQFCTVEVKTSRQSGHSIAFENLVKNGFFNSAIVLCEQSKLTYNYLKSEPGKNITYVNIESAYYGKNKLLPPMNSNSPTYIPRINFSPSIKPADVIMIEAYNWNILTSKEKYEVYHNTAHLMVDYPHKALWLILG